MAKRSSTSAKNPSYTLDVIATGIALSLLASTLGGVSSDRDFHEVLNGNSLHFRVRGQDASKPYLLLLHGGPGFSSHMFYPWGSTLEQNLNVVYLDQRGCGESASLKPNDFAAYTMPGLIADIEAVRDYLKVKKWFVLGHSWGGMLGLEYVRANPKSVLGYVHVDGLLSQPMTQDAFLTLRKVRSRRMKQPQTRTPRHEELALSHTSRMRED